LEASYRLTRGCLEVCRDFRNPVGLITKSALIERDIDILQSLNARNLVQVTLSITTMDHHISRYLEPRTAAPAHGLHPARSTRGRGGS